MNIDLYIYIQRVMQYALHAHTTCTRHTVYTHVLTHTRAHNLVRHLLTYHPLKSRTHTRTHTHLIGVSRIGASLQHRTQTRLESEACACNQEPVLVVVRDLDLRKVLHNCCLHLVLAGEVKRRLAALNEEGRQCARGVGVSMPTLSRAHPV